MKKFPPAAAPAIVAVCLALLMPSCRRSGPADADAPVAASDLAAGKRWRLAQETIAADSIESYKAGADALRTLDAFGSVEVNRLFYHGKLMMVPAGTLVAAAGAPPATPASAIEVRVLEGAKWGKTLWLYPESAERMGFRPPQPAR